MQFFPCCAFAIRSFSKVSATPVECKMIDWWRRGGNWGTRRHPLTASFRSFSSVKFGCLDGTTDTYNDTHDMYYHGLILPQPDVSTGPQQWHTWIILPWPNINILLWLNINILPWLNINILPWLNINILPWPNINILPWPNVNILPWPNINILPWPNIITLADYKNITLAKYKYITLAEYKYITLAEYKYITLA